MKDLKIVNGSIVDGTGTESYVADILIDQDRIISIGNHSLSKTKRTIDARGLIVTPGFIDMHSHSDLDLFENPEAKSKILQGITTELLGQDGISVAPVKDDFKEDLKTQVSGLLGSYEFDWDWNNLKDYFNKLEETKTSTNVLSLIPYGQIRACVMGMKQDKPDSEQIKQMQEICKREFENGAVGISIGLIYTPCVYAEKEEIIEVVKIAAEYDGFLVSHIRNESDAILESLDEIIEICKEADVPLHISHFKLIGEDNWDKVDEAVAKLENAISKNDMRITFDQYPYIAASTMMSALIPPWYHEGGMGKMLSRLKVEKIKTKIKKDVLETDSYEWENYSLACGWENIFVSSVNSKENKKFIGKSIKEISEILTISPIDVVFKLLIDEKMAVSMVMKTSSEDVVQKIMKLPFHTVGTDGLLGGKPHPRAYGTFPRFISRYVRDKEILTLEEAIKHITLLPADILNIKDRGIIKENNYADLVVFDFDSITDKATFEEPIQYPEGIKYVLVNGEVIAKNGNHTGIRSGKVLRTKSDGGN